MVTDVCYDYCTQCTILVEKEQPCKGSLFFVIINLGAAPVLRRDQFLPLNFGQGVTAPFLVLDKLCLVCYN